MNRSCLHHVINLCALLCFSMNLIHKMHAGYRSMCGVIVVDVGRSRSTNIGRDAYIHDHFLGYLHNYFLFYQLPNSNLFTHCMLFSWEKPLVKSTALDLFRTILFSDLLFQKSKNTLLHFFFIYFILFYREIYLSKIIQPIYLLPKRDWQPLLRVELQVFVLYVQVSFT